MSNAIRTAIAARGGLLCRGSGALPSRLARLASGNVPPPRFASGRPVVSMLHGLGGGAWPDASGRDRQQHRQSQQQQQLQLQQRRSFSVFAENASVAEIGQVAAAGLGNATPVGLLQNTVEAVSALSGQPWAVGIVGTTLVARVFLLPVVFGSMRNNTRLMNIRPETELHTERLRACQQAGDKEGTALAAQNLNALFTRSKCHPLKSFVPLVFQAPIFISFFMGLRKMGEADPAIEGLSNGGMLWFPDLSAADPTYALPIIASATMLATIELGSDGVQQQQQTMRVVFRGLSLAMIPMTASFPAAVFVYWITSNIFSLSQVLLLKIPGLKQWLDIPEAIQHATPAAKPKKGFVEELRLGYQAAADRAKMENERTAEEKRRAALANTKLPPPPPSIPRMVAATTTNAAASEVGHGEEEAMAMPIVKQAPAAAVKRKAKGKGKGKGKKGKRR